jgi:peptidoglycan/xylan/chitin deacetylase (PgdA/CDA1 family)
MSHSINPRKLARRLLTGVLPRRMLLDRGPRGGQYVYFTFDDGPHPEYTPRLLDELAAHCLRATFFVIGSQVQQHPQIVRRILAEGHALGSHSWSHLPPERTSASALAMEMRQTSRLIEQIAGVPTNLCRPPYGALSAAKLFRLWGIRQTVVLWSVDPRDYACQSSAELEALLRGATLGPGDIVLLHDNRPCALGVVGALAEICLQRSLRPATIHQALGQGERSNHDRPAGAH